MDELYFEERFEDGSHKKVELKDCPTDILKDFLKQLEDLEMYEDCEIIRKELESR